MMWGATLILFCYVATQGTAHEIKVECRGFYDFPPTSNENSPSFLEALRVKQVTVEGEVMMNISWAINIDASNKYLTGTRIVIQGESYHCKYNPDFAKATSLLNGSERIWFHHLQKASYGSYLIQAANLPLPPTESGPSYNYTTIVIPRRARVTSKPTTVPIVEITTLDFIESSSSNPANVNYTSLTVAVFGGLAGLMILSSCFIIYKSCGNNFATSLSFKRLPTTPVAPVPVLVVYPAVNSAFQGAVVALAEFLQWHGGCSVVVDMWQQGKIAELGPMCWLTEQAKAARVLIVCPQVEIPSHSPPIHTFPEPTIPAAAHDLYPLILNMVASQAKNATDLAKFWVVQLGEHHKKPRNLAPQLRACKTFCLMKDLNKLCRSLHTQSQDDKKRPDLIRPRIAYSEKCTVKLRDAVKKLSQPSISREMEPLKSVVAIV